MKGVIISAGLGTRLMPLTKIISKNLLPVYNKPLIYYPINTLIKAGINEILIIVNGREINQYKTLLKNGEDFDIRISYAIQEEQKGTAHALSYAEEFADNKSLTVILGDNIFEDDFDFSDFRGGARVYLKEVHDPERFGIADIKDGKIISIEEKPKQPKSNYAIVGLYLYDNHVFDIIRTLKPSVRGELEITDANKIYLRRNKLDYRIVKGYRIDAGTFDSMLEASNLVKKRKND